jgi:hypothetical protein
MTREVLKQTYTLSEANVNDLIGWLRAGQINHAVIALEHLNPVDLAQSHEWAGLTGEEREECEEWLGHAVSSQVFYVIEAKLKEKNT